LAQTVYRVPIVFFNIYLSYLTISLSLNVVLTLMIVVRLLMHRRNIRTAIGDSAEFGGLYHSIITTIVESYAPYTIVSLINLALFVVDSPIQDFFGPALGHVQVRDVVASPERAAATFRILFSDRDPMQVIAPFLVTLRVANRRALTGEMVKSGSQAVGSIQFRSQGYSTGDEGTTFEGNQTSLTEADGGSGSGEYTLRAERTVDEVPL
jgi:hypothetical protein